jgi:hypothetical protein
MIASASALEPEPVEAAAGAGAAEATAALGLLAPFGGSTELSLATAASTSAGDAVEHEKNETIALIVSVVTYTPGVVITRKRSDVGDVCKWWW